MSTTIEQAPAKIARDLDADLAICEAATSGPWDADVIYEAFLGAVGKAVMADCVFTSEARTGWPYAIRRAQEAEQEADKLREENALLLEQLQQHRGLTP